MSTTRCTFCGGAGTILVPFALGLCVICATGCRIEVHADHGREKLTLARHSLETRYLGTARRGSAAAAAATYEAALRVIKERGRAPGKGAGRFRRQADISAEGVSRPARV